MKDEIKEILEALKPHDEEFTKAGIKEFPLVLSIKEQKILLDYITNLQKLLDFEIERNDIKQDIIDKAIKYIKEHKRHEYRNGNDNEYYLELDEDKLKELTIILQGGNK